MVSRALLLPGLLVAVYPLLSAAWQAPDPVALLKRANDATAAVAAVRYEARAWGAEGLLDQIPTVDGTVAARPTHRPSTPCLRIEASLRNSGGENAGNRSLICDGRRVRIEADGHVRRLEVSTGFEQLRVLVTTLWLREFSMPAPFSDEIEADIVLYEGRKTIGGVRCDVVFVRYNGRMGEARWYLGADDHLPRRVDRILGGGTRVTELRNLQVTDTLPDTLFHLDDAT